MSSTATVATPPPAGLERRVEAFAAAHAGDGPVDPARFLPPADDPAYLATAAALARAGLELACEAGRPSPLARYRAQLPELFARADLAAALDAHERQLRARYATGVAGDPEVAATCAVAVVPPGPAVSLLSLSASSAPAGPATRGPLPGAGDELLGFELVEELGRGSFGCVFLARQRALSDRPVALKVTARPSREAQHLARLQHTNIVPVLSVHERGPLQAVCMPYYGRTTLRQVLGALRRHDALPASGEGLVSTLRASARDTTPDPGRAVPAEADPAPAPGLAAVAPTPTRDMLSRLGYVDAVVWLGARLADGLAHAHERGILHRDLKPENVLLADDGQPMLLDFNLADDAGPGAAGHCGGTLLYMAPEHLAAFGGDRTRPVDARSDLYALGIVLYELLTKRHPSLLSAGDVITRTPAQALRAVREAPPDPVRRWNPAVSPAVGAAVAKLLHPDPARRYQTARQLQEDLERHLANRPLRHAGEPSLRERATKFVRRHPRALPVAALTVAVGLVGALSVVAAERARARERADARAAAAARAEAEARAATAARARFVDFQRHLQDARVLLTAGASDPVARAAGEDRARAALALYGADRDPEWAAGSALDGVPEADRAAVRADVGEALFLLARQAPAADALELTARAERCYPDGAPGAFIHHRAELADRLGRRAEAAEARRAAEGARARGAEDEYLAGAGHAAAGRWAEAVPPLERACRLDPRHPAAAFTLGYCLQALGRDAEALESYRGCVALRPDVPWAYLNRGVVYLRRGDHARARAELDDAVRLGPAWADAHFTRATLFQQTGQHAEALADFDKAEALKTPRARLYLLRAQSKLKLNDPDGAAQDRARGLAMPPADEFDFLARGAAYLPAEPEKALAAFDAALALNPRSAAAMQNRAHVLAEHLKRGPDAVKALDALVELYPAFVKARGGRAVLSARLGDRAAAHRDAAECLRRDTAPGTLYQLAGVYALTSAAHPEDRREALRLLAAAFTAGFRDFATLGRDTDLDPVRALPEFSALVKEFRPAAGEKK